MMRLRNQARRSIPSQLIAVPKLFALRQISWSRALSMPGSSAAAAAATVVVATAAAAVVVAATVGMGMLQGDI